MSVLESPDKPSKLLLVLAGFILIGMVGFVDYLTGSEIGFSIFYVLPISLITWITDKRLGFVASIGSAALWAIADLATRDAYSHALIPIWNTLIRLTFFIIITLLLSALRKALRRVNKLARVDYLTGAANSRFFYYLARREVERCQRYKHPFTVAYIDLDNFKAVNDQFGHSVGDRLLNLVVSSIKNQIRKTDVVARLGGDEFVLLLPETNQQSARLVVSKVQSLLTTNMQKNDWMVTFSVGVVTYMVAPESIDSLVKTADELMYSVKFDGKNAIRYQIYTGEESEAETLSHRSEAMSHTCKEPNKARSS